jgi:hypothetical protein
MPKLKASTVAARATAALLTVAVVPKPLNWFPRPPNNTRKGIHLGANGQWPLGEYESGYDEWIVELKAMGVSWAKATVFTTSGLEPCRRMLAAGIQPIIRFYIGEQWPNAMCDSLDLADLVRQYVAIGARYFEVGNEPNLLAEWKNGWGVSDEDPTEWKRGAQPDRIAQAFVRDAQIILDNGGIPGLPACSPGGNYNDIDFFRTMCARLRLDGHADLLARGCFIAIHNGTLNHPLDYPGDPVNQEGVQLTREEYEKHSTWAGSLELVNAERIKGKNPGQHLLSVDANGKDTGGSNCFRKFEALRSIFFGTFGFDLPILGTEGGVWVGETIGEEPFNGARIYDPRYPAVSKEQMTAWMVEISEKLMDNVYPEYYFCDCEWLIANKRMGNPHQPFERDALFSHYWEEIGGHLPVVDALKALPKRYVPDVIGAPAPPPVEPPVVVPPDGVWLTMLQVLTYARAQGLEGEPLIVAGAIAWAESGGHTRARGYNEWNDSQDLGVWQIQLPLHMGYFEAIEDAYDPAKNAHAMWEISDHGTKWTPWMTFTGGDYLAHMAAARAASLLLPAPEPSFEELVRFAYEKCLHIPYTPQFALMKAILADGLSVKSQEGRGTIQCGPWVGQVAEGNGELWLYLCRDKDWQNVKKRVIGRA